MEQNQQPPTPFPNVEEPSAEPLRNGSEEPRGVSEAVRNEEVESSERLSQLPKLKQRTGDHNVTVRAAAKLLEAQGHPITERTIINWCYPTKTGPEKLDCAWDETKIKYFITHRSIDQVMADMPKAYPSEPPTKFQKDIQSDSEYTTEIPKEKDVSSEQAQKGSETQDNSSETPQLDEDEDTELRRLLVLFHSDCVLLHYCKLTEPVTDASEHITLLEWCGGRKNSDPLRSNKGKEHD